jgi:NAD(P)-dependent dehydrogenase (short-subunit alcohol dehydrogenase family)
MQQLRGRVAVVTGAASGIGRALAGRFARDGMKLVLADIEAAPLAAAGDELRAAGADVMAEPVDVADAARVEALAEAAYRRFGAVHLLCNNAGVAAAALRTPAWETRLEDWHWTIGVNLMGVVHGIRAFVPRMLAGGDEGHVVNTASVAGLLTGSGPYFASKHGVVSISEGLYKDLKAAGAKVSASVLCPGVIRTAILEAERNRPPEQGARTDWGALSESARAWAERFRAELDAGWEPSTVADAVAEAVQADRFYIVPAQPAYHALLRLRLDDLAALRNPTLPPPR